MPRVSVVFAAFLLVLPGPALAAELFFGAQAPEMAVGESFAVGAFLDAQGESVNAVEGSVTYDGSALRLEAVRDGESLVALWIERPQITACEDGRCAVRFSGAIPGGISAARAPLFSLVFTALRPGKAELSATGFMALLNDGKGTAASAKVAPIRFTAREGRAALPLTEAPDEIPPEPFAVTAVRTSLLYGGSVAAAFSATDKQTGIDHYEVAERAGAPGPIDGLSWARAQSPYLLVDQALGSSLYVKAVDRAGNARVSVLSAGTPPSPLSTALVFRLALLCGIIVFVFAALRLRCLIWRKPLTRP